MVNVCHVIFAHMPFDGRIFQKEVLSLHRNGYRVTVLVPQLTRDSLGRRKDVVVVPQKEYHFDGVRFVPYRYRRKAPKLFNIRMRWCLHDLLRKMEQVDADIYHFHEDGITMEAAVIFKERFPHKKIIFDYHESFLHQCRDNKHKMRRVNNMVRCENKLLKKVDMLICLSDFLKRYYRTLTDAPISVIMNCQSKRILTYNTTLKQQHTDDVFRVVHEGNMVFDRGFKLILETARHITDPAIRFLLVGKIPAREKKYFDTFVAKYKIEERFELTGQVPYREVASHLIRSQVGIHFVMARNAQTGLSNKFFNYLCFGLPILSLSNHAADAIIKENNIGFIFDKDTPVEIAHTIEKLHADTELYGIMTKNAQSLFSREYNWEQMEQRLLHAYAQLQES